MIDMNVLALDNTGQLPMAVTTLTHRITYLEERLPNNSGAAPRGMCRGQSCIWTPHPTLRNSWRMWGKYVGESDGGASHSLACVEPSGKAPWRRGE